MAIPEFVLQSFLDQILGFLVEQGRGLIRDTVTKKKIKNAIKNASIRFENEYSNQELAKALNSNTRFYDLESIRKSIGYLLEHPFDQAPKVRIEAQFKSVLPTSHHDEVDAAADFFIERLQEELMSVEKLQAILSLIYGKRTAEATERTAQGVERLVALQEKPSQPKVAKSKKYEKKREEKLSLLDISLQPLPRENGQYASINVHNNNPNKSVYCAVYPKRIFWLNDDPEEKPPQWIDITNEINAEKLPFSWHLRSDSAEEEIMPERDKTSNLAKFESSGELAGRTTFTFYGREPSYLSGKFKIQIDVLYRADKTASFLNKESITVCMDITESLKKGVIYELGIWECENNRYSKERREQQETIRQKSGQMPKTKRSLKVFLCHARADAASVRALYARLTNDGVDAWFDKAKLLPGQDWELEIRKAAREADVVVVCLSKQFNQAGFRQKEVRLALDTAMEQPEGEIFIIPARLEECETLESLRKWHWVDLYEDDGYEMLMRALRARADKIGATLQVNGNVINWGKPHMPVQNEELESKKLKSPHKLNTKIIIALIGTVATIIVILISLPLIKDSLAANTPLVMPTTTPDPSDFIDVKGIPMRLVPSGEFMMGSDNGDLDEKPVHSIYLNAFYIDKYEVTNARYKNCVDTGECKLPTAISSNLRSDYYDNTEFDNYPVINVDWNMAVAYCEWRGSRLPTEAEWEKAAHGIYSSTYPWGESIDKTYANYGQNLGDTVAVGSYENGKNIYGVYDMAGNVWEWTTDWYQDNYYSTLGVNIDNPQGPQSGQVHVLRGGSWYSGANDVRSASRWGDPSYVGRRVGFRCASSHTTLTSPSETPSPSLTPTIKPTSTNTYTPTPSSTPTQIPTATPHPETLRGINQGCIDEKYWKVSASTGEIKPTPTGNCYNLIDWGVVANNEKLSVVVSNSPGVTRAIYTAFNSYQHFEVTFNVEVKQLSKMSVMDNVLVLGVGKSDALLTDGHFLFYRGYSDSQGIYYVEYDNNMRATVRPATHREYLLGTPQEIKFVIDGLTLEIYVDNILFKKTLLESKDHEGFWIGYRLESGGSLDSEISNLSISK